MLRRYCRQSWVNDKNSPSWFQGGLWVFVEALC